MSSQRFIWKTQSSDQLITIVEKKLTQTKQVASGVPQGSLLGPLLFIIFGNDLPLQVTKCEAFGYADDFKLVATNNENIQYAIKQIEEWCLNNKMTLNENKCYILPIKSQDKPKLS